VHLRLVVSVEGLGLVTLVVIVGVVEELALAFVISHFDCNRS
jgi:hypothetical protein